MVLPVDRRTPAKKLTAALLIKLVRHPVPPQGPFWERGLSINWGWLIHEHTLHTPIYKFWRVAALGKIPPPQKNNLLKKYKTLKSAKHGQIASGTMQSTDLENSSWALWQKGAVKDWSSVYNLHTSVLWKSPIGQIRHHAVLQSNTDEPKTQTHTLFT